MGASDDFAADGGFADAAPQAITLESAPFARVINTNGLGLMVRTQAATDAESLGFIPETCVAELRGETQGAWVGVRYAGMEGWSHRDYLAASEDDAAQCSPPSSSHVQVKGTGSNGLRVRAAPDANAEVLETISEQCVAQLTGLFTDQWVQLRFQGTEGWSHRDFLAEVPADTKQCGPQLCTGSAHCWPLTPQRVTSEFGPRWGRMHEGIDFGAATGHPVYATKAGRVITASYHAGYGNHVRIDHGGGETTTYGHFSKIRVSQGDWVEATQRIGDVGSTGNSTGPHLHYEIRFNGVPKNPRGYLP